MQIHVDWVCQGRYIIVRVFVIRTLCHDRSKHTVIMSRILSVALLLIVLADSFYHSAAVHNPLTSGAHIRKCRCKVLPNGTIKCRFTPSLTNKQDQVKCLCKKNSPQLKAMCDRWRLNNPLTMV